MKFNTSRSTSPEKSSNSINDFPYIIIPLAVFTIMILSLCFQDTINYDEYFSMQWCRLSYRDLMATLIADVHPPLYYLLLKPVFDITNENMFCARILSAGMAIALLWAGALFLYSHFGKKSALFYTCFLYLNPFMVQKSVEIRMYMMAGMFTIASGIFSYYILKGARKKHWICFTISSLLAAYTHYYALLAMCFLYAGIAIYFIFTKNKKDFISWLICAACTIAAYLPWLPVAWKQVTAVNEGFWISAPASRLAPLRELFYSTIPYSEHIYLCVMALLIILALIIFIKEKSVDSYWSLMCSSALCGIMVFTIWYASHVRPILVSRYLIMAICLCILGISCMTRFLNKYIVLLICLFCVLTGGISYWFAFRTQADFSTTKTINFINEKSGADDTIIYIKDEYGHLGHCIEYYFPGLDYIGIDKENLSELDEIIAGNDGVTWFFAGNEELNNIQLYIGDYTITDCGTYGFSTNHFNIYEISEGNSR